MIEEVIEKLPEILKKHICTLKKASKDITNGKYMSESDIKVINFDKIPNEYSRGKGWNGIPKSNDALYIDIKGKWYFIEFKNGTVDKGDIYRKIYDSLVILIELKIIPDIEYVRENIDYILVYNEEKYGKIPNSEARNTNYNYIMRLAKQEKKLFDIDKFEKYLFNETHTYTEEVFQNNFVKVKESEECMA